VNVLRTVRKPWQLAVAAATVALVAAGCGGGISEEEAAAKDAQIAALQQDARYWQQLTGLMKPVEMSSMSDHRAFALPSGYMLATSTTSTSTRPRT